MAIDIEIKLNLEVINVFFTSLLEDVFEEGGLNKQGKDKMGFGVEDGCHFGEEGREF